MTSDDLDIGNVYSSQPYRFADLVEILCAFENKSPFSKTNAYDIICSSTKPGDDLLDDSYNDLDDDNIEDDADSAEVIEKNQNKVEECFECLEYRAEKFETSYPFKIDGESLVFEGASTYPKKLYLFLLAASRVRTFKQVNKCFAKEAPDIFEDVSKDYLSNLMGKNAKVVCFGPRSQDRQERFGKNLRNAIPKLAEFMGVDLTRNWDEDLKSQGDRGLDVIGVRKLDDDQREGIIYLGQSTITEEPQEWEKKAISASDKKHTDIFTFNVPTLGFLFIPSCFRKADGTWYNKRYAHNIVFIDRVRLMHLIGSGAPKSQNISKHVDDLLELNREPTTT